MTKPEYKSQISLGNVIQVGMLVVALAGSWAFMQSTTSNNADEIDRLGEDVAEIEVRVRSVELSSQGGKASSEALAQAMERIERTQRENNALIRQLLVQVGKTSEGTQK